MRTKIIIAELEDDYILLSAETEGGIGATIPLDRFDVRSLVDKLDYIAERSAFKWKSAEADQEEQSQ